MNRAEVNTTAAGNGAAAPAPAAGNGKPVFWPEGVPLPDGAVLYDDGQDKVVREGDDLVWLARYLIPRDQTFVRGDSWMVDRWTAPLPLYKEDLAAAAARCAAEMTDLPKKFRADLPRAAHLIWVFVCIQHSEGKLVVQRGRQPWWLEQDAAPEVAAPDVPVLPG